MVLRVEPPVRIPLARPTQCCMRGKSVAPRNSRIFLGWETGSVQDATSTFVHVTDLSLDDSIGLGRPGGEIA